MSRLALVNLLLAVLLVLLAAAHMAIPTDPTKRNYHFFPNMVESLAHEAQGRVPLFEDGRRVDLRPPVGAIARGYLPEGFEVSPEGAAQAGAQMHNPVAAGNPAALERGAFLFTTFCVPCHGAGMQGDGAVTKKGVPPPPSLLVPHAREMADGQIWHVITHGQGNMAGYGSQVAREDRWNLVAHIRQVQAPGRDKQVTRALNPSERFSGALLGAHAESEEGEDPES